MADLDIGVYQKILDDPLAEYELLRKRVVSYLQDSVMVTNHTEFHFVMMVWSMLHRLAQEFSMSLGDEQAADAGQVSHDTQMRYRGKSDGQRVLVAQLLKVIRENLDELDSKKPVIMSAEKDWAARKAMEIRAELVCCDIYQRLVDCAKAAHDPDPEVRQVARVAQKELYGSTEYHAICHWGEYAARIVEGKEDAIPIASEA